jgi:arsenical pump membrane protein
MPIEAGASAAFALAATVATLMFAAMRPRRLPEITVAGPAAAAVVALGIVPWAQAVATVRELAPTVLFLAAILIVSHLAQQLGVFVWLAGGLAQASRGHPIRMLALVFLCASVSTAALNLDATIVLLAPLVVLSVAKLRLPAQLYSYALVHLANSASLLLPVSNLTNLLAFSATGLGFLQFTAHMAGPWLAAVAVEFLLFLGYAVLTRQHVRPEAAAHVPSPPLGRAPMPVLALTVLALMLVGFGAAGFVGIELYWIAAAAAAVLGAMAARRRVTGARQVVRAASLPFCLFVLALAVVVAGLVNGPLGKALADLLPRAASFTGLLAVAVIAAALANAVNNLPATLLMLAALGPGAPPALILAMLVGVNIGPNLTYSGSLATLLWRRMASEQGHAPRLATFTWLGVVGVPATLAAAVGALWLGTVVIS